MKWFLLNWRKKLKNEYLKASSIAQIRLFTMKIIIFPDPEKKIWGKKISTKGGCFYLTNIHPLDSATPHPLLSFPKT